MANDIIVTVTDKDIEVFVASRKDQLLEHDHDCSCGRCQDDWEAVMWALKL